MDRSAAQKLDAQDPLRHFKSAFVVTDPDMCYLDGNSLGRLPHATGQVLACDTTSVNFYQLASAAIKARPNRKTIIIDAANFPTDRYIMQGLAQHHGLKLITINNEDPSISSNELITPQLLEKYLNDDVALVSLEVVQYRSGARQNIKAINDLVKSHGALMLWDAAHAVGSVAMNFDANGVELAVGCTYKYGNSGPGAPAWLYVSTSMQKELRVPIQGWFAQRDQFAMGPEFQREDSIRGFQIASPSLMGLRCIKSAFAMIEEAGIENIENKAARGTEMMIELFDEWLAPLGFTLNTPRDPQQRGGHISLVHPEAEKIAIALRQFANVIPDYRVPNSIRVAISPLATSYTEVFDGFQRLRDLVSTRQYEKVTTGGSRVT